MDPLAGGIGCSLNERRVLTAAASMVEVLLSSTVVVLAVVLTWAVVVLLGPDVLLTGPAARVQHVSCSRGQACGTLQGQSRQNRHNLDASDAAVPHTQTRVSPTHQRHLAARVTALG